MALLFVKIDSFIADGFEYLHRQRDGKDVYTLTPLDGSMNPRTIDKKEYKAIKQAEHLRNVEQEKVAPTHSTAFRVLLPQNSANVQHSAPEYDAAQGERVVRQLCDEYDILLHWHKNPHRKDGLAYITKREILVPKPEEHVELLLCFHEIAHIVLNASKHTMNNAVEAEYACEMWAIRKGFSYGSSTEDMLHYREYAKRYIRLHLVNFSKNKAYKPEKIPAHIAEFAEIDPFRLVGAKTVYNYDEDLLVIHQEISECKKYSEVLQGPDYENPNFSVCKCNACGRIWMQPKKQPAA